MAQDRMSLAWRKSSASGSGNCVEVAVDGQTVLLRDSKENETGPVLEFTEAEWKAFLSGVEAREFTLEAMRQN
jgi:predicted secreted Zn-dependent protease